MAGPLIEGSLLLGHSARITPDADELKSAMAFAEVVTGSNVDEIEKLQTEARKLRVVDTSIKASYSAVHQRMRLEYVAALNSMRKLGLQKNTDPFIYTPIHFRGIILKDIDRVRTHEYWRDQCYTLYSYAVHEYRQALEIWEYSIRNCTDEVSESIPGPHIENFFPFALNSDLKNMIDFANRGRIAIATCCDLYNEHMSEGDNVAVLAESGDSTHLTCFHMYLKAFVHECVVIYLEFHRDANSTITEEMSQYAHYAKYAAKWYYKLSAMDRKWVMPDQQSSYSRWITRRAKTWNIIAQLLAARYELSILQNYKLGIDSRVLVDKISSNSLAHIYQPLETLDSGIDDLEQNIAKVTPQTHATASAEVALCTYVMRMSSELIDLYQIYTSAFDRKPRKESAPYHLDAIEYPFSAITKKAFSDENNNMENKVVGRCGQLHFVLEAKEQRIYPPRLASDESQHSQFGDLLELDNYADEESRQNRRNEYLETPGYLNSRIDAKDRHSLHPTTAYYMGITEERLRWIRALENALKASLSLEDIIQRFKGDELDKTYECYDIAIQLSDKEK